MGRLHKSQVPPPSPTHTHNSMRRCTTTGRRVFLSLVLLTIGMYWKHVLTKNICRAFRSHPSGSRANICLPRNLLRLAWPGNTLMVPSSVYDLKTTTIHDTITLQSHSTLSSMSKKVLTRSRNPPNQAVLDNRMQLTLHATRRTPHGSWRFALGARNFCLVGENPTCSVPA